MQLWGINAAILRGLQSLSAFQVSSQNALLPCCNVNWPWIAFYPGALLQQGGKEWPFSRITGGKGLLASCLYLFSCPFSFLRFRREVAMLVLSRQEHGDIQLGWISGSGYCTGDSASCKCWVKRESFRKGQGWGCNPAICTSPRNNRYLLFSWPFFTDLSLLLVCWCPQ